MSLRNRIVVVFVLLIFVVPVTGFAASAQLNPDGQQLTSFGNDPSIDDRVTGTKPSLDGYVEPVTTTRHDTSTASFFDRFLVWLQAMVQPL